MNNVMPKKDLVKDLGQVLQLISALYAANQLSESGHEKLHKFVFELREMVINYL